MKFKTILLYCLLGSPSFALMSEVKQHLVAQEGLRNFRYTDSQGFPTIGVGHRILDSESKYFLTDNQAMALLEKDASIAMAHAQKLIPSFSRHPKQLQVILVSLCFNLGPNGFAKFVKFRSAMEKGDYAVAAKELRNSRWAKQVPVRANKYIGIVQSFAK